MCADGFISPNVSSLCLHTVRPAMVDFDLFGALMRRASLLFLLALLTLSVASCDPGEGTYVGEEECRENTAPRVGNLEINSVYIPLAEQWAICFHLDWEDPGIDEVTESRGTDAPNMLGGIFSLELSGYSTVSHWLDEGPSPQGVTIDAPSGELEALRCLEEGQPDQRVDYALRLRDRCGASSQTVRGTYYLGGGSGEAHLVQNPEAGTDGCAIPVETACVEAPPEE